MSDTTNERETMTTEQLIDRAVQRRLATDLAYRYAENADEQAEREEEITREEEERITRSSLSQ
jgi:hypothetical protein